MAPLLTWRFTVPRGEVWEEVVLDDDGSIERLQARSEDPADAAVGWWFGTAEAGVVEACRELAGERWPGNSPPGPRQSAAGAWSVSGAAGRVPLDAVTGGAVGELLAAGSSCRAAANQPSAAARVRGRVDAGEGAATVVLEAAAVGDGPVGLAVETDPPVVAAWSDDQAEIAGFLGEEVALRPGAVLVAALLGMAPAADGLLRLAGEVSRADGARAPVELVVAL